MKEKKYVFVKDGKVVGVYVYDTSPVADGYDLVIAGKDITGNFPGPGWAYDATAKAFSPPEAEAPLSNKDKIKQALLKKIKEAGVNPTALNGTATGKAVLFLLTEMLNLTVDDIEKEINK